MSRSNKTIKRYIDQFVLLAGSTLLIVMALIVALNFSKDANIFAKKITQPKKSAAATVLPQQTERSDDFSTYKYTRDDYKSDAAEEDKLGNARIEIINYSGDEKLSGIVKSTLKNAGYSNVVIGTADTESKTNRGSTSREKDKKSTAKPVSMNTPISTKESNVVNTPGNVTKAPPTNTPDADQAKDETTTPLPTGIESNREDDRDNGGEVVDNKDNQSKKIINETQIIERSDKKLGDKIKKIIKAGKVIKKIDSKYQYDVTIILGKDFIP